MSKTKAGVIVVAVLAAGLVQAAPTWPVSWNVVTVGGSAYVDKHWHDDPTDNYNVSAQPASIDILGDATHAAAYWANDGQNLMFRIRVDGDPSTSLQYVWSAVLNTGGDATADYVLQLDLKTDNQVEMAKALAGNPGDTPKPWVNLSYEGPPSATHVPPTGGLATDWYRFVAADTDFGGDPGPSQDYFIDFAFDLATFESVTGLQNGDPFQVVFASSTDHVNAKQDLPDYGGWSDVIAVPEPTALALLSIGCAALILRRRSV